MRYKIIDQRSAGELTAAKLRGESVDFAQHEQDVGKGAMLSEAVLAGIAQKIEKEKRALEKAGEGREKLDAAAFEMVHAGLPAEPDLLCDSRFWIRFALVYLFDVVVWRFPGRGGSGFNVENLGIGGSTRKQAENYLYKLWVRGELAYLENNRDPYLLGRFGDIDFWTSHIHRQSFSSSRNVAKELVRYQYPPELKGRPRLLPGEEDIDKGKLGVRTLVKRVRRVWATVEYSLLESDEIKVLLKDLSRGLTTYDGKHSQP